MDNTLKSYEAEQLDGESIVLRYVPVNTAMQWEDNPKLHNIDSIMKSINEYGFRDPPTWDATLGGIVEGNGRTEALDRMQNMGMKTPRGILTHKDTGEWCMPILFGIDANSISMARKYAIDHNNLVMSGGEFSAIDVARLWSPDGYAAVLQTIIDDGDHPISVDFEDFATLQEALFGDEYDSESSVSDDTDEQIGLAEELLEKWQVQEGDLWEIRSPNGNTHRLLCGSSVDADQVNILMDGNKFDLMITDPPYGVSYADKNKFLNAMDGGKRVQEEIANDHLSLEDMIKLWVDAFKIAYDIANNDASYYVTSPQGGDLFLQMMSSLMEANWQLKHTLIWVKNNHVLGRADYNYKHEPILYGWKDKHNFYGAGQFNTSVWEIDKPQKSKEHPTMKPVELFAECVLNSSVHGNIVYDPFSGSGTTLIACEKLGRNGYGCELEPKYCSVILERLELLGCIATKLNQSSV